MKQIILKALARNALTTAEVVAYVTKHQPKNIDPLTYKQQIARELALLKREGVIMHHTGSRRRGRYRKVGKEVSEWYYNLKGQDADRMKKAEGITATDLSKKQLADLYTKYHLNRVNLTPFNK